MKGDKNFARDTKKMENEAKLRDAFFFFRQTLRSSRSQLRQKHEWTSARVVGKVEEMKYEKQRHETKSLLINTWLTFHITGLNLFYKFFLLVSSTLSLSN